MALDDNSRYDVALFQMGENVFCTVWWYRYQSPEQFEISIYGSGDMYYLSSDFIEITGLANQLNWDKVWRSCSGECGAHGSSPRPAGIIYVPGGITSIAEKCFHTNFNNFPSSDEIVYYNTVFKIVVEGQITHIGDAAFSYYPYNTYELVKEVGTERMVNDQLDKLKEVDFMVPGYVEYLGNSAFQNRTQLVTVDFGGHTPNFTGSGAFMNCYNLRSVNIGHGKEISPLEFENGLRLNTSMFENCFSLIDAIPIKNAVTNSLKNCYALGMISITDGFFIGRNINFCRCDKVLYNSLLSGYRFLGDSDPNLRTVLRNVNFDGDYFSILLNSLDSDVTWPCCHDWHNRENRRLIESSDGEEHRRPYIAINSYVRYNNVPILLTIPLYPTPQSNSDKYLPINFDGRIWWLDTNRDNHSVVRDTEIYWNDYTGGSELTSYKVCYGRFLNNVN